MNGAAAYYTRKMLSNTKTPSSSSGTSGGSSGEPNGRNSICAFICIPATISGLVMLLVCYLGSASTTVEIVGWVLAILGFLGCVCSAIQCCNDEGCIKTNFCGEKALLRNDNAI